MKFLNPVYIILCPLLIAVKGCLLILWIKIFCRAISSRALWVCTTKKPACRLESNALVKILSSIKNAIPFIGPFHKIIFYRYSKSLILSPISWALLVKTAADQNSLAAKESLWPIYSNSIRKYSSSIKSQLRNCKALRAKWTSNIPTKE